MSDNYPSFVPSCQIFYAAANDDIWRLKCREERYDPTAGIDSLTDGDWALDDNDDCLARYVLHVGIPEEVTTLSFLSRDRSSGTGFLHAWEQRVELDAEDDGAVDPQFFEKGFSLEAKTGFQVWPGSRLLLDALIGDMHNYPSDHHPSTSLHRLKYWQQRLRIHQGLRSSSSVSDERPLTILELGSGIGIVGTCLAAMGAHVILTDLPVLVKFGVALNLLHNAKRFTRTNNSVEEAGHPHSSSSSSSSSPITSSTTTTLASYSHFLISAQSFKNDYLHHHDNTDNNKNTDISSSLPIVAVGRGFATSLSLDWFQPLSSQLSYHASSSIDLIVACDCIFLRKLVDPLLDVVSAVFDHVYEKKTNNENISEKCDTCSHCSPNSTGSSANNISLGSEKNEKAATWKCSGTMEQSVDDMANHQVHCLFTFQRRRQMGVFISIEELLHRIESRGWRVACIAWRKVEVEGDGEDDLYLFEISPGSTYI